MTLPAGRRFRTTRNQQVKAKVLKSAIIQDAVVDVIEEFSKEHNASHLRKVLEVLGSARKFCAEGIVDLLVSTRGDLFHYSIRSPRPKDHPLNHAEFESLAFLAMSLSIMTIVRVFTASSD